MRERRVLVVGLVVSLLVGAAVVDRLSRDDDEVVTTVTAEPIARAVGDGASTWFCPIANAQEGMGADGSIIIHNTQRVAVRGLLTLYPVTGAPVTVAIRVPARSRLVAHEVQFIKSAVVGAVVELDRGGVAVEQDITGPLGESSFPCATAATDTWHIAEGSTALNNNMFVGLFNPFPDDAIVDVEFATEQGAAAPGAFQGIVVAARSVVSLNIGDHVRRRDHVALTAHARRGRIVVGRIQTRTAPRSGLTAGLAAPAPSGLWDFPDGIVSDVIAERFHLYNPSNKEANVQLALTLDQGAAEPFDIKVPARGRVTFDPGAESRVPKGVGHSATVRSDVPVVAERTVDYSPPAPRIGISTTLGATRTARQWLLPQGGATDALEEWVVVHNIGRRATTFTVAVTTSGRQFAIAALQDVDLPAGQRVSIRLLDFVTRPDLPIVVDADQPVVVERVLARVGRSGVSHAIGVPVRAAT